METEDVIILEKENVHRIDRGDIVVVNTDIDKINGAMPTPSAFKFAKDEGRTYNGGGMSIFEKEDDDTYINAFLNGDNAEFFLNGETKITVYYGGKVKIEYHLTWEFFEYEGVTIDDMREFVAEYLLKIGKVELIKQ